MDHEYIEIKNYLVDIKRTDVTLGAQQAFLISFCFSIAGNLFELIGIKNRTNYKALKSILSICSGIIGLFGIYSIMRLYTGDKTYVPNSKALSLAWLSCMMNIGYGLVESMNIYSHETNNEGDENDSEKEMHTYSKLDDIF